MTITAGIDIGNACVKVVIAHRSLDTTVLSARVCRRIRRGDPAEVARAAFDEAVTSAGVTERDVDYVATTGEPGVVSFHTGHFYAMTAHARGAIHLDPATRAVLDVGALHGRAVAVDPRGKVLGYRMTSQCASGSGRFLENIARWLGVSQDEIGALSLGATDAEPVSSICAVLAETDVINMVSRGIAPAAILRGIHLSMAGRLVKLLETVGVTDGVVTLTGGLASDEGFVGALAQEIASRRGASAGARTLRTHEDAIFAGAIGAALWGAFRHEKLGAQARSSGMGVVS